jgi:hypothetical protein
MLLSLFPGVSYARPILYEAKFGGGISSFDARAGRGSCLLLRHHGLKAMASEQVAKIEWPVPPGTAARGRFHTA